MDTRGDSRQPQVTANTMTITWLRAGERAAGEDVYICFNCGEPHPPVVSLHKGDQLPPCTNCGSEARWLRV